MRLPIYPRKSSFLPLIGRLAARVEKRWIDSHYDDRVFARIAIEELGFMRRRLGRFDPDEIGRWLLDASSIPYQVDLRGDFGQPPLILFSTSRFMVQLLFWLEGTTSVHQHGFHGAFMVLRGSSLHSRYHFEVRERVSDRFALGKANLRRVELLRNGDIRAIGAGCALIHSLFHLETPSVTLVVRTIGAPTEGPQYTYHLPAVSIDPGFQEPLLTRRLQFLDVLLKTGNMRSARKFGRELVSSDMSTAFQLLQRYVPNVEFCKVLLRWCEKKHGPERARLFRVVLERMRTETVIIGLRKQITSPEHRFLLALLLNLPDRRRIFQVVREQFPGRDPEELVLGWIGALSKEPRFGLTMDEANRVILSQLLRNGSRTGMIASMKRNFCPPDVAAMKDNILEQMDRLKDHPILRPLFQ